LDDRERVAATPRVPHLSSDVNSSSQDLGKAGSSFLSQVEFLTAYPPREADLWFDYRRYRLIGRINDQSCTTSSSTDRAQTHLVSARTVASPFLWLLGRRLAEKGYGRTRVVSLHGKGFLESIE
jgi:hypothetical protein